MSLFQCENCGSVENTALSVQGVGKYMADLFDWDGHENKKGLKLCSQCIPPKYDDGTDSGFGKWHGEFQRTILPLGKFKTNNQGNLEHIETGDIDYRKYKI